MGKQLELVLIVMDFAQLGIGGQKIMLSMLHLRCVSFVPCASLLYTQLMSYDWGCATRKSRRFFSNRVSVAIVKLMDAIFISRTANEIRVNSGRQLVSQINLLLKIEKWRLSRLKYLPRVKYLYSPVYMQKLGNILVSFCQKQ